MTHRDTSRADDFVELWRQLPQLLADNPALCAQQLEFGMLLRIVTHPDLTAKLVVFEEIIAWRAGSPSPPAIISMTVRSQAGPTTAFIPAPVPLGFDHQVDEPFYSFIKRLWLAHKLTLTVTDGRETWQPNPAAVVKIDRHFLGLWLVGDSRRLPVVAIKPAKTKECVDPPTDRDHDLIERARQLKPTLQSRQSNRAATAAAVDEAIAKDPKTIPNRAPTRDTLIERVRKKL
jgi:hypothetical protein